MIWGKELSAKPLTLACATLGCPSKLASLSQNRESLLWKEVEQKVSRSFLQLTCIKSCSHFCIKLYWCTLTCIIVSTDAIFFSEFLKTSNAIAVAPNPRSYCRCSRWQIPFVRTTLSSVSLTEMPGKVHETDHCVTFGVQTSLQSNVSSSNDNSLVKDSLHRSTKDAALNVNMLYFRYQPMVSTCCVVL